MLERRKFGAQGRNMHYPFAVGDLINSASVLKNYMENAPTKVPWDDLRYLFGEIMYGGADSASDAVRFFNLKFASMASTRCHVALTPSRWP